MVRLFAYAFLLLLLMLAAVWIADNPGAVRIDWLGWRVSTSVPVLMIALTLFAGGLYGLIHGSRALWRWPSRWRLRRHARLREKGYQALTDGLAAAAAGRAHEARKMAARAEKWLKNPRLTRLLSAQSAALSQDETAMAAHYEALRERPETELLGLRGLLELALKQGRRGDAIGLAQAARKIAPEDRPLAEQLFRLLLKTERLEEAQDLLTHAARYRAMDKDLVNRRRALVANEKAREAESLSQPKDAMSFSRMAVSYDPTLTDAALRLARVQAAQDLTRQAASTLERAWRAAPRLEVAESFAELIPNQPPLQQMRRLDKLALRHEDSWVTHRVLGEVALSAKLWGAARQHLLAAARRPTASVLALLAKLELAQHQDQRAADSWLRTAALPEPAWQCGACGKEHRAWHLFCPQCDALDSLAWQEEPASVAPPQLGKTG